MSFTDDSNNSIIVRTLETMAALNTKIDMLLTEVTTLRQFREDSNKSQNEHGMKLAEHDRAITDLRCDVTELQERPGASARLRHAYMVAALSGCALGIPTTIVAVLLHFKPF